MKDFNNLVIQAQQGDQRAMTIVIRYMQGVINKKLFATWKEVPGGQEIADMAQIALIGVLKGISAFNPTEGSQAVNWLWMHVNSVISEEVRYLTRGKRVNNIQKSYLDAPVAMTKNDGEPLTLGVMLPSKFDTERDAVANVDCGYLQKAIRSKLSHLEGRVFELLLLGYKLSEIVTITGFTYKSVEETKKRIKNKTTKILGGKKAC